MLIRDDNLAGLDAVSLQLYACIMRVDATADGVFRLLYTRTENLKCLNLLHKCVLQKKMLKEESN